ncbi:hypothetical protein [Bradyrhizobium diazoefficiens]
MSHFFHEIATPRVSFNEGFKAFFNAGTFASSLILLVGVFVPDTLKAIGNLKPFLLFAGVAGGAYSLRALLLG